MRIFKQQIDLNLGASHYVDMPAGATILTTQLQYGVLCIWFLCDPTMHFARRRIVVYGTGHELPPNPGKYIGTVQLNDGGLILHVFDQTS